MVEVQQEALVVREVVDLEGWQGEQEGAVVGMEEEEMVVEEEEMELLD